MKRAGSFWVLIALLVLPLMASAHRLGFEWLNEKNGLSSNLITDLHQDKDGFLWIATLNGLNRFDGYRYVYYYYNESDSASLPASRVNSLSEDPQGRLWIATGNGIAMYDPKTQKITRIHVAYEKNFKEILDVFCDSRKRVWLCTEAGVYLINYSGERLGYWTGDGRRDSMPYSGTYKTEEDPWGNIWVLSKCGLAQYLEGEKQFKIFSTYKHQMLGIQQTCTAPTAVIFPDKNEIICASWASGILRFNRKNGTYVNFLHSPQFKGEGAFNIITGLAWFDQKLYVASHDKGLGWFDTTTNRFTYLRDLGLEGMPLPTMQTSRLLVTGSVLWAGTTDGLFKLDLRTQMVDLFRFNHIRKGDCLPDIHHTTEVGTTGDSLSVASWTCGMWIYDKKTQTMVSQGIYSEQFFKSHLNLDFWMSYEDSRGVMWYPCSHGLFRKERGQTQIYTLVPTKEGLSKENYFTKVVEDRNGNIWAGSLDGILFFEKGGKAYRKFNVSELAPDGKAFLMNQLVDIDVAPGGDLWFTCSAEKNTAYNSLLVFRINEGIWNWKSQNPLADKDHRFPQFKFYDLMIDKQNRMWTASSTGIRIFKYDTFQLLEHLTTIGGLFSDQVQSLTEDYSGKVWALFDNGFETDMIDPSTFHITRIGSREGLPNALTTSLQSGKNKEVYIGFDRHWFGIYNPALQYPYEQTYPVRVTGLSIDGKEFNVQSFLNLDAGNHMIEMEFSPMNLLTKDLMEFEVLVENGTDSIKYTPEGNKVILNGLDPGLYTIKLVMNNRLINKVQTFRLMSVSIAPLWYQKIWVQIIVVIFLVLISALSAFLLSARLQKQKQKKAEKERELESLKLKALRAQMNPHFIFNALNSINKFIWENKAEEASDYLNHFAKLTRLILEHTREDWVGLQEDLKALDLYLSLESTRFGKRMKYDIHVEDDLNLRQILIPPMLIQPFAENAIKHAFTEKGKEYLLQIRISMNHEKLLVEIEDNGSGRNLNRKIGHKSISSIIVQDRLKMIDNGHENVEQIVYVDKANQDGAPSGTIVRFVLPYIKEKEIKNEPE